MLLYCDHCARKHNYGFTITKDHGDCELCGKRVGRMNVMKSKDVKWFTQVTSKAAIKMCGFTMKQIEGFVPGTAPDLLHPGMRRIVLTQDKMLFQGADELIMTTVYGKQFRVTF